MTEAASDVPLICDAPLGGLIIVTCDRALTMDQRMRLETIIRRGLNSGALIVDGGVRVEHIPARAWPDAEFCAA